MSKDLIGPAAFGAANPAAQRPPANPGNVDGAGDTWFLDCSSATSRDGTQIKAGFLNFMLAQVRRAIRGMGVAENNTDDDMLLKAIQAASGNGGGDLPAHTHPISQVTDLQVALDGKSPVGHSHDGAYLRLAPPGAASQTVLSPVGVAGAIFAPGDYGDLTLAGDSAANKTSASISLFGRAAGGGYAGEVHITGRNASVKFLNYNGAGWVENARITPDGRVGIGTENPVARLDVAGSIRSTQSLSPAYDVTYAGAPVMRAYASAETLYFHSLVPGKSGAKFGVSADGAISVATGTGATGQIMTSGGAVSAAAWTSLADLQPRFEYIQILAAGQTLWMINTPNVWINMPLNVVMSSDIPGASAAGGNITLPAGTYDVHFGAALSVGAGTRWKTRLRDTTNNVTLGVSLAAGATGYEPILERMTTARFTLAAPTTISLQTYSENSTNGIYYANPDADGEPTIISRVSLTKIG